MSESNSTVSTGSSGTGAGAVSPVLPSYDNSLGAILIGSFTSIFLYGVTCLQVFIYYQRYPRDKPIVKYLVYVIWAIDSFDAALAVQICYFYLITNYSNPIVISSPVWSLKLHVLVTSLSDFIVRSLFARRIYTLNHGNKSITGSIIVLSIADLVVGIIITIRAFSILTFSGLTAVAHLFYLNFATNITADLTVAAVLSYYLWTNRTGFERTDSLVVKLIMYTINTGLITFIVACLGLICYIAMPTTLLFITFYLNLSKFYVNSYLASLNVRKTLLSSMKAGNSDGVSIHVSHCNDPGLSQDMPAFRSLNATGLDVSSSGVMSTLEDCHRYPRDMYDFDLEISTGTDSSQSKGDASTAVNTPIDGIGTLPHKELADEVGMDKHRYPPGILVPSDNNGLLEPVARYEAPPTKDEEP